MFVILTINKKKLIILINKTVIKKLRHKNLF